MLEAAYERSMYYSPSNFRNNFYHFPMTFSLEHLMREPTLPTDDPAPVLILLHGLGSNEQDLFSFAPHLDPRYRILSVRAPRAYAYQGFAWFDISFGQGIPQPNQPQMVDSQQRLLVFLDEVRQAYRPSRIYLAGFSQGAIMSYAISLTQPTLVSGVLAMSGYIIRTHDLPTIASDSLKDLPIFATHGLHDQILPVFLGRSSREYLQSLQLNHFTYQEYPMAHEVSSACFGDCARWLSQQVADL